MSRLNLILVSGLLLLVTGCSKSGQNQTTPSPEAPKISSQSVVKVSVTPLEIKGGESHEALVNVTTQGGYHINANPASFEYLKATELELEDTSELLVDYIYYPNPQVKKFAFSEQELRVYEGETQLKVMLNAEKTAAKGSHVMPAKLNVQACDDKVCYPPATIDVSIPVTIK
jgi:hypothetical protein